jgi:hypothetical protein
LATLAEPTELRQREINMKRAGFWAIGIGALAGASLITMEQAYAGENDHPTKCTLATLNGQYLFGGGSATLFPPAAPSVSIANSAGFHIFNGDGTGTDFVTLTVNGIDQHVPSPAATTYTINQDCTGTLSVQNGPKSDIFVAVDGSALTGINTDPGVAASGSPSVRVGKPRSW